MTFASITAMTAILAFFLALAAASVAAADAGPFPFALNTTQRQSFVLNFRDVTRAVGFRLPTDTPKWGGPVIADIDGDGVYDVVWTFHATEPLQLYWGNGDGTFTLGSFTTDGDIHGVQIAPLHARTRDKVMVINKGGGRGARLVSPSAHRVTPSRTITNVTTQIGLNRGRNRGRVSIFMNLALNSPSRRRQLFGGPDVTVVGFRGPPEDGLQQFVYENNRGRFSRRDPGEFRGEREGRVALVDVDNDGILEMISFPPTEIYKLTAPFRFQIVNKDFASREDTLNARTTAGITEFDYNNDGVFDMYLARTILDDLVPERFTIVETGDFADRLFVFRDGALVDVSRQARIPRSTRSMSAAAGDFDNNGFLDLFVSTRGGPDFFLMNNGDETFTRVRSTIPKRRGINGDHAVAVDYDQDGRVDLFVSQGGREDSGPHFLMRNVRPFRNIGNYLHVRVQHEPRRTCTALHAVVTVEVGGMTMTRRVAGSGSQSGGPSYFDLLHFGLGRFNRVDTVRVRWECGAVRSRANVRANTLIFFGRRI